MTEPDRHLRPDAGTDQDGTALAQPTREEVLEEIRQLVTDLRDATQDGRNLAKRYADVLQNVVDEYCLEFEKRAEAALEKLENFK